MRKIELSGKRFGRLMVAKEAGRSANGHVKWECLCDCGNTKIVFANNLTKGLTKSCGCLSVEMTKQREKTHGLRGHQLYYVWDHIKSRCYNQNNEQYRFYGGVGIVMSDEWKDDFLSFYSWCINNGWVKGLEIDKDIIPSLFGISEKKYCPEFCCLVTPKDNVNYTSRNIHIEIKGVTKTFTDLVEESGLKYSTAYMRHKRGWPIERVFCNNKRISKAAKPINENVQEQCLGQI